MVLVSIMAILALIACTEARRSGNSGNPTMNVKLEAMAQIQRRKTISVRVGNVHVGSGAPVVVQSMTNTDTADIPGTIQQVAQLAQAGSELVRVTVNNDAAAKAIPAIVDGLEKRNIHVPIIG